MGPPSASETTKKKRLLLPAVGSQAELRQDLGCRLFHRQELVARVAVLGDLPAAGAGVRVVVATEAPGKVGMADVVRIYAPRDLHLREHIAVVNIQQTPRGANDVLTSLPVDLRITLAKEGGE